MAKDSREPRQVLVEACVTTLDEAVACERAGAGRLELCVDLNVGGLTPPTELVAAVCSAVRIPVCTMVRPRPGSFVVAPPDLDRMLSTIAVHRSVGSAGLVLGVLHLDGRLDVDTLGRLVEASDPLPVTFHRAFDLVPHLREGLHALAAAGVSRVLTSGGAATALDGADVLGELVRSARGRVSVMPGGRVRADHVHTLLARTGAMEVHARASAVPKLVRTLRHD